MGAIGMAAVKAAVGAADRLGRRHRGITVLIYHRVGGGSGSQVDLDPALFEAQVEFLAVGGRVITLDDALRRLVSTVPAHDGDVDPVVITFDDGTADFTETALPILVRHRIPSVLYVATDFVERGRPFPGAGRPVSWTALADALTTGLVTVGSHTHTHALLDRTAAPAEELDRSIELIGERLGVVAEHFAYPKAVAGSVRADTAVRQRFRSAALAGTRANRYGATDPWRLARSPIQVSDGMRWFHRKLDGGMGLEDSLRSILNRRRYASATT